MGEPATARRVACLVHADDFGLTPGVNAGILATHQAGVVSSASLMTTTPGFTDAVALARRHPSLDLGLHLNLTTGPPCLPPETIPSLVDRAGRFHALDRWLTLAWARRIDPAETAAELTAQAERAMATDLRFSHLDGHHHIHLFAPARSIAAGIARRFGLRVVRRSDEDRLLRASPVAARLLGARPPGAAWRRRWLLSRASRQAAATLAGFAHADYFGGLPLLGPGLDTAQVATLFTHLPPGTTELMCHPGYGDAALAALDPSAGTREREVALLTNPALLATIRTAGVTLIRSVDLAVGSRLEPHVDATDRE